jgi:hypothetical protein
VRTNSSPQGLKPGIFFFSSGGTAKRAAEKGLIPGEKGKKHPAGAKARVDLIVLTARLKSCPVTKQAFFRSL